VWEWVAVAVTVTVTVAVTVAVAGTVGSEPLTVSCRGDLRSPRWAPAQAPQARRETILAGGGCRDLR
jgi:uncharacterized protein (DUF3084 family)